MRDNRKFADNEIVYVNGTYNIAEKCKITKFVQKESRVNKSIYALQSLDNYGSFAATEECIFKTKEDALKAYKESSNGLIEKYKNEIKTLEELIKFPLSHCIACGEEYTEEEAREAYKIRAKEITGIDIDIEFSEKQIKEGKTKDARKALSAVREKYGL